MVALMGGLGNQLFQASFADYLSKSGVPVGFDVSCVKGGLALSRLPNLGEEVTSRIVGVSRHLPGPSGRGRGVGNAIRAVAGPRSVFVDMTALGPDRVDATTAHWWFGYWQRARYTANLRYRLHSALAPDLNRVRQALERSGPIAIHYRGGDYRHNPMLTPPEWYGRALKAARDRVGDRPVVVCTNDPGAATRELSLGSRVAVRSGGSDLEDFLLMASADALIASRSTFSWWAGSLSAGTVVVPTPWHPGRPEDDPSVLLRGWLPVG